MRYLARRTFFYLVSAWAAITLNFLIPRLMPGNPVENMLARYSSQLTPSAVKALTALFGLNRSDSLWHQYISYWGQLFRGDLGTSFTYYPTPVASVIRSSLPWSLALIGTATVLSFIVGTLLGVLLGWRRGSRWDALAPIATFFSAVPYFWLALASVYIFGVELRWLPLSGGYSTSVLPSLSGGFIGSALYHSVLPALTILVSSMAGWLLGMRNMMVTTMGEDYVLLAQAKGLPNRRVVFAYAARNAILPSLSSFAMSLGFVVGGAILVEVVFSYPGIGFVLYQGVTNSDYPLVQGIFLVITLVVLAANFIADLIYVFVDPRTRQQG